MNLVELNKLAYHLMIERKAQLDREKGYLYYHGERVSKLSIVLREKILPNDNSYDEYLIIASLFHDIGKGFQPHAEYGALLVREMLKGHCEKEEVDKISELIRYHQGPRKDEKLSDYIKIVQDADIIDRFGTIQIWLNFYKCASEDEPINSALDFYINQFSKYVCEMRNLLNYDISKEYFDDRVEFLKVFINRLITEAAGGIYIGH